MYNFPENNNTIGIEDRILYKTTRISFCIYDTDKPYIVILLGDEQK